MTTTPEPATLAIKALLDITNADELDERIEALTDDELTHGIRLSDEYAAMGRYAEKAGAFLGRKMRIEEGRRQERLPTGAAAHSSVTPGITLTPTERVRRSEERLVAGYGPSDDEIRRQGWKKLVKTARIAKTPAAPPPLPKPDETPEEEDHRLTQEGDERTRKRFDMFSVCWQSIGRFADVRIREGRPDTGEVTLLAYYHHINPPEAEAIREAIDMIEADKRRTG